MPTSIQPIITTADVERLLRFYTSLLDAEPVDRYPQEGEAFFVALRVGESTLGLVADADAGAGPGQRMLLSVDIEDVDGLLGRVEPLGGHVLGPPNDMPWGQRVAHVHDPDGNMVNLVQQL